MLKKADIVLAVILIVLGMIPLLFSLTDGASEVTVTHDGVEIYRGSLAEDKTLEIDGKYHNVVVIENGKVFFSKSDCPNGDCVEAGAHTSGVVACAPNGVIVTIGGAGQSGEVDTVAE